MAHRDLGMDWQYLSYRFAMPEMFQLRVHRSNNIMAKRTCALQATLVSPLYRMCESAAVSVSHKDKEFPP